MGQWSQQNRPHGYPQGSFPNQTVLMQPYQNVVITQRPGDPNQQLIRNQNAGDKKMNKSRLQNMDKRRQTREYNPRDPQKGKVIGRGDNPNWRSSQKKAEVRAEPNNVSNEQEEKPTTVNKETQTDEAIFMEWCLQEIKKNQMKPPAVSNATAVVQPIVSHPTEIPPKAGPASSPYQPASKPSTPKSRKLKKAKAKQVKKKVVSKKTVPKYKQQSSSSISLYPSPATATTTITITITSSTTTSTPAITTKTTISVSTTTSTMTVTKPASATLAIKPQLKQIKRETQRIRDQLAQRVAQYDGN